MHVEIPVGNESEAATGHVCRPFTPRNLPSAACDSKNTNVYLFYHHYNLLYIITKLTFQKKSKQYIMNISMIVNSLTTTRHLTGNHNQNQIEVADHALHQCAQP